MSTRTKRPTYPSRPLTRRQQALVEQFSGLPIHWVRRMLPWLPSCDRDDAVAAATAHGLLRAAQCYDPARGAFGTYASWWVRQAVQRWTELYRRDRAAVTLCRHDGEDFDHPEISPGPDALAEDNDFWRRCRQLLANDPLAWQCLEARYRHAKTLKEVGRLIGRTKERARQLIARGLERLREQPAEGW